MTAVDFPYIDSQTKTITPPPSKFQIDPYKVSRVVAICFALLAAADIILRLGLTLSSLGFFATPIPWIICGSITLISAVFIAVIYYIHENGHQKNYKDPEEVERHKKAAVELNFDNLLQEHTPHDLVTYIFNEQNPSLSLSALQEKFQGIAKKNPDFKSLIRNYDLKQLMQLNIIDKKFFDFLLLLEEKIFAAQKKHYEGMNQLEKNYPLRLSKLNHNISRIYDFFRDPYKIVMTGIRYGIESADVPNFQELDYNRSKFILQKELNASYIKLQNEYKNRFHEFFPSKKEAINEEDSNIEYPLEDLDIEHL